MINCNFGFTNWKDLAQYTLALSSLKDGTTERVSFNDILMEFDETGGWEAISNNIPFLSSLLSKVVFNDFYFCMPNKDVRASISIVDVQIVSGITVDVLDVELSCIAHDWSAKAHAEITVNTPTTPMDGPNSSFRDTPITLSVVLPSKYSNGKITFSSSGRIVLSLLKMLGLPFNELPFIGPQLASVVGFTLEAEAEYLPQNDGTNTKLTITKAVLSVTIKDLDLKIFKLNDVEVQVIYDLQQKDDEASKVTLKK